MEKDEHISKLLTLGPKTYYYVTNKGKECTKVKGFSLHHNNAAKINGQGLELLLDKEIPCIKVSNSKITRDRNSKQLINKDETKTLSLMFDKRVITQDFNTIPYGYR